MAISAFKGIYRAATTLTPMLSERMFAPFDIQDLQQRTFAIRLMLGVSRKAGDAFANSG